MTPKERAAQALDEIWPRRPHTVEHAWPQDLKIVARAIRAAVEEEREACAKWIEALRAPIGPMLSDEVVERECSIAAAIRERKDER